MASASLTSVEAQLTADQLELTIRPSATTRVLATFTVHNGGRTPAQAMITREDWDRLENGDNRFGPSGTMGNSCGTAMSFYPAAFRIDAGAKQVVRVAIEKTSGPPKECWDIIFVQDIPQTAPLTRSALRYVFRTGVKVYVAPAGLSSSAEITGFSSETIDSSHRTAVTSTPSGASQLVAIQFHNTGGLHLVTKGRIEFRTLDNSTVKTVPIAEFPTLPGARRRLVVDVPGSLPPGRYIALALLDYHGAVILAAQLELNIKGQ